MTVFAAVTGKQLVAALGRAGFEVYRVRGSHHFLRHPGGRGSKANAWIVCTICCRTFFGSTHSISLAAEALTLGL